ncbi:MAG: hypothetical protein ABSF83_00560 [Nitrososphaerales archaeon]
MLVIVDTSVVETVEVTVAETVEPTVAVVVTVVMGADTIVAVVVEVTVVGSVDTIVVKTVEPTVAVVVAVLTWPRSIAAREAKAMVRRTSKLSKTVLACTYHPSVVVGPVIVVAFVPAETDTLADISTAAIAIAEAMARYIRDAGALNPKTLLQRRIRLS